MADQQNARKREPLLEITSDLSAEQLQSMVDELHIQPENIVTIIEPAKGEFTLIWKPTFDQRQRARGEAGINWDKVFPPTIDVRYR
jgi:hypothetical protein